MCLNVQMSHVSYVSDLRDMPNNDLFSCLSLLFVMLSCDIIICQRNSDEGINPKRQ